MMTQTNELNPDIVLIGAGIMSATLAVLLKELEPGLSIHIYERLPEIAAESSDAWNNAGTGHSGFCELNYTPVNPNGSIDISKATKVAGAFELSKEFWSYLVGSAYISDPKTFINNIPHMSFVWGDENVDFLRRRYEAMIENPLFAGMQYSEDRGQMMTWMPLVMKGRDIDEKCAATRMELGTDVNFGALTRAMIDHLHASANVSVFLAHEIRDIERRDDGTWEVTVKNMQTRKKNSVISKFVFIGAGGATLPLLEKSDIPEAEGYGGFPISGQWLRCINDTVISEHAAKVYGKASVGAPPMSVPHLDTRMINGKKELLFGPFAGFSTKFLKSGSYLDLPMSLEWDNIFPMLSAGWHNIALTKYLIQQVRQSMQDKVDALREYLPEAEEQDWKLEIAGQRVQVIKRDKKEGGILEFGTEIVTSADGTLAALLGASPGASTATSIMLEILKTCFEDKFYSQDWQRKLKQIIPSYGVSLADDAAYFKSVRQQTATVLGLKYY